MYKYNILKFVMIVKSISYYQLPKTTFYLHDSIVISPLSCNYEIVNSYFGGHILAFSCLSTQKVNPFSTVRICTYLLQASFLHVPGVLIEPLTLVLPGYQLTIRSLKITSVFNTDFLKNVVYIWSILIWSIIGQYFDKKWFIFGQ